MRLTPTVLGPWSERMPLFTIPETMPDRSGEIDENVFCYAGKAHPQFAPEGQLLVTYVCNLFARSPQEVPAVLERLRETPSLYRPKIVPIELPLERLRGDGAP